MCGRFNHNLSRIIQRTPPHLLSHVLFLGRLLPFRLSRSVYWHLTTFRGNRRPKISVYNYQSTLRNTPEGLRSHLQRCRNLKQRNFEDLLRFSLRLCPLVMVSNQQILPVAILPAFPNLVTSSAYPHPCHSPVFDRSDDISAFICLERPSYSTHYAFCFQKRGSGIHTHASGIPAQLPVQHLL